MIRQNITVDLVALKSKTDRTAQGILDALSGGAWVFSSDVDRHILAANGDPARKVDATKALRNMGYPVATVAARHHSRYRLYADTPEMEKWRMGILTAAYSQQVTTARSLAGAVAVAPTDPALVAVHTAAEMSAIQMGRALGKSLTEIINDLLPI